MFSQAVIERIGYYVYFLRDPRDQHIFYVGKGQGNRLFMHVTDALETSGESDKLALIREIKNNGYEVEHFILRHELTQEIALEVESAMIDFLELTGNLTNIVKGHHSFARGLKTVKQIIEIYNAEEVEIGHPILIIIINKLFNKVQSKDDLYNYTRSCWKVGERRNKIKYVLSVYRGLVREVYKVHEWKLKEIIEVPQDKGRWFFEGEIAEDSIRNIYLGKSVQKYIGAKQQNPVKYVLC